VILKNFERKKPPKSAGRDAAEKLSENTSGPGKSEQTEKRGKDRKPAQVIREQDKGILRSEAQRRKG